MHGQEFDGSKAESIIASMSSNQGRKDSISSSKADSLVETWGQAVFQDGGSADHENSLFPVIFLMYK